MNFVKRERLIQLTIFTLLLFFCNACSLFEVNHRELKIMEGKWKVTSHHFTFFIGQNNQIQCDTILSETGVYEFHKSDEYGGTFSFTPEVSGRPVSGDYTIKPMDGIFELIDLKTNVVITLYAVGGSLPLKEIKIIDFGKSEQVWYADYSLNLESGANETFYVKKD